MPVQNPHLVRLLDLIPVIQNNTRLCIKCRFKGMKEYQNYYGSELSKLPAELLNTLCVENITSKLDVCSDGIIATLVICVSDDITMISIDPSNLLQQPPNDSTTNGAR